MGVPWAEATAAGALMGTKTVFNELIAYVDLGRLAPGTLGPRSLLIMTYGLCGFANPGSLGIMVGGMGTLAPGRRPEIVALGLRSLVSGTLTSCLLGSVIGIVGA
jgi:CNT family concentrative nucleoside transporter